MKIKKYINILLWLFITKTAFAQPTNINLSTTTLVASEPFMAINPTNTQNIVVGWMALDASTGYKMAIKTKASFDGGTSWANQNIQPHFSSTWNSADVSMHFTNDGMLHLTYVDFRQSPDSGGVFYTHSIDGGVTWIAPIQVWNGNTEDAAKRPFDRPWIVADNSGSINNKVLYLTTKPAPWITSPSNRPYLKFSADSGQTWSTYRYIDTTNYLVGSYTSPMASPAVGPTGAFFAAYPSYNISQSPFLKFFLAKSNNRGGTFTYSDIIVSPTIAAQPNYKKAWHLAANPANSNQLAFAYIGSAYGDPDVFITTTNNGGSTWSSPVRANDDAISNGKGQDLVWISYSNIGTLLATWRDRRNAAGTGFSQPTDIYYTTSSNNGASFKTNKPLTSYTLPHDTALLLSDNAFMCSQMLNGNVYATWGDVRTGNLNIFFTKVVNDTLTFISELNHTDNLSFSFYPNPASAKVTVKSTNSIFTVSVCDIFGSEIAKLEQKGDLSEIDVSKFPNGTYILKIYNGKYCSSQKIIVQH
ncbi:MAG: T9SS type A sorting domain-containing protein [Bacteroidia bacterium]|nr:T9SS type A sorting domain-containing protein [Bacteroidia bacterium]